jgi:lysophospholipase L1-like esterase
MDCLIVGGRIGVGWSQVHQGCIVLAESGINSRNYMKDYRTRPLLIDVGYNTVVISLGSNDPPSLPTTAYLTELRNSIQGKKVYWILPIADHANAAVFEVARQFGDATVVIPDTRDKVHPTAKGYSQIAKSIF